MALRVGMTWPARAPEELEPGDPDELKMDRGFVAGMRAGVTDREIVRATIIPAATSVLSAAAEGVEDEETWHALRDLGCTLIQGYHLARPLPADEVGGIFGRTERARPPNRNLLKTAL